MGSRPESDDRPLSQPTPSGLGSMAPRYAAVAVEKVVGDEGQRIAIAAHVIRVCLSRPDPAPARHLLGVQR